MEVDEDYTIECAVRLQCSPESSALEGVRQRMDAAGLRCEGHQGATDPREHLQGSHHPCHYPSEDYDFFVSRMIRLKKERIESMIKVQEHRADEGEWDGVGRDGA